MKPVSYFQLLGRPVLTSAKPHHNEPVCIRNDLLVAEFEHWRFTSGCGGGILQLLVAWRSSRLPLFGQCDAFLLPIQQRLACVNSNDERRTAAAAAAK